MLGARAADSQLASSRLSQVAAEPWGCELSAGLKRSLRARSVSQVAQCHAGAGELANLHLSPVAAEPWACELSAGLECSLCTRPVSQVTEA